MTLSSPPPASLQQRCGQCREVNEEPFLFCEACGTPRVRVGHWRIVLNVSLAFMAFTSIYLAREYLSWSWPLYFFFWLFCIEFMLLLLGDRARLKARVLTWSLGSLAAFFLMFHFMQGDTNPDLIWGFLRADQHELEPEFMIALLGSLPGVAREFPLIFFAALGGFLLAVLGFFYVRWGLRYGWINAYRIVILSLLAACLTILVGIRLAVEANARGWWPGVDWSPLMAARTDYHYYAGVVAVNLFRVFVLEIFIYSAIRGYAEIHATPTPRPRLDRRDSVLVRSVVVLAFWLRRFVRVVEQMFLTLWRTLRELVKTMGRVAVAFSRELLLPALAMIATGVILYRLLGMTQSYIDTNRIALIPWMVLSVATVLLALMVFMACQTPFRTARIAAFYSQLVAWLMPNLVIFFLIISLSLWLSAQALAEREPNLPYRLGLLTKVLAATMAVLVVVIVIRKRALFAEAETEPAGVAPLPVEEEEEPKGFSFFRRGRTAGDEGPGLLGVLTGAMKNSRPAQAAARKAEELGLDDHARRARVAAGDAAKRVKETLKGRPPVVDKLERASERMRIKLGQIETLSGMQGTVDAQTYDRLMQQHRSELRLLRAEREQALIEYTQQRGRQEEDLRRLRDQAEQVDARRREFDQLKEAGALNEAAHRAERKPLDAQARDLQTRIQVAEQMLSLMETQARMEPRLEQPAPAAGE